MQIDDFWAWLTGIGFGLAIGFICGMATYDSYMKSEAIKHGAAQYRIIDENSGKIEFVWKENK